MKKQKGILFDLDGVIFQGNRLIPGAKKTLQLSGQGVRQQSLRCLSKFHLPYRRV